MPRVAAAARVLTRGELAKLLKVSPRAVSRFVASGRVPPPLALSRWHQRWDALDIEAWIAAGSPPADEWKRLRRALKAGA